MIGLRRSMRRHLDTFMQRLKLDPPKHGVQFGDLRRLQPISRVFAFDRGQPIDRYYIDKFLSANSSSIRGRVLEIAENTYTRKFGGDRVEKSDILHATEGNPEATIIGDLTKPEQFPADAFDCAICTQLLPFIYDIKSVIKTLHRILKPGGVLLTTTPGISQISRYDMDRWGDYWRFTPLSARLLFEEVFPADQITVESHGNVLAAVAFLHGIAAEELTAEELDFADPDYPLSISIRACKPLQRAG